MGECPIMRISHLLAILVLCAGALAAQRVPAGQAAPAAAVEAAPVPPESSSVTEHDLALDGKTLHYVATAGTLLINDEEDKPYCSIFYVGYTLAGVTEPRTRSVTFLYNG